MLITLLLWSGGRGAAAGDTNWARLRSHLTTVPALKFELVALPPVAGFGFDQISAVAADREGNLHVLHRTPTNDPVVVLDPAGKFLRSWGKGMFTLPHAIRLDAKGDVWTVDAGLSGIFKFTPEGRKLLEINIGGVPAGSTRAAGATDIAFGRDGHLFVADGYSNARVIEYDAAGAKVREWGRRSSGPGEFQVLHSIAISATGVIHVADRDNGRVQRFSQAGEFLGAWEIGGQVFSVAFGPTGECYVATHRPGAPFDRDFVVLRIDPGDGRILGWAELSAHEIAVGPGGNLLPGGLTGEVVMLRPGG